MGVKILTSGIIGRYVTSGYYINQERSGLERGWAEGLNTGGIN